MSGAECRGGVEGATGVRRAAGSYPATLKEVELDPLAGTIILPAVSGQRLAKRGFYFMWHGNKAFIKNGWKIGSQDGKKIGQVKWKLFNLTNDRAEQHDLAKTNPEMLHKMVAALDQHLGQEAIDRINKPSKSKKSGGKSKKLKQKKK